MLATMASVNSANRLKKHLKNKGVASHIIQTPSSLTREGCGYSLRFSDSSKSTVIQASKELRINIRAFYREETTNSQTEYIKE